MNASALRSEAFLSMPTIDRLCFEGSDTYKGQSGVSKAERVLVCVLEEDGPSFAVMDEVEGPSSLVRC